MTALLQLTASSWVATTSGPRAALAVEPGDTVEFGPGIARRVRDATRTVLVRDAGRRARWPILVAAGSLGDGKPATDLLVAPDQVLPVAGGLGAPARYLVDGQAIHRAPPEGPLDFVELHLDAPLAQRAPDSVLPGLVESLAATRLPPPGPLQGGVDDADAMQVSGWAHDPARPGRPQLLTLCIDGIPRGLVLADIHREDLQALTGGGDRAFRAGISPPLTPRTSHRVTMRRALDGAPVADGERLVGPAPSAESALAAVASLPPEARARALSAALLALGEAARG